MSNEQPMDAPPSKGGRSLTGFYVAIGVLVALGLLGAWMWTAWNKPQAKAARLLNLDGEYTVMPWDTYPEFGKLKTVSSITMSIRKGRGNITIAYADGSSYVIRVSITETDTGPGFTYVFPGYEGSPSEPCPLRAQGSDLQMYYCRRWTTFAVRKSVWPARGR